MSCVLARTSFICSATSSEVMAPSENPQSTSRLGESWPAAPPAIARASSMSCFIIARHVSRSCGFSRIILAIAASFCGPAGIIWVMIKLWTSNVHHAFPIGPGGACGQTVTMRAALSLGSCSMSMGTTSTKSLFVAPRPWSTIMSRSAAGAPASPAIRSAGPWTRHE